MKIKIIIISFLILFFPKISFSEEAVFINGFEDLPLMEGMTIIEDAGISFDSLSGTIVEVYAEIGELKPAEVFSFYKKTLPQLGWTLDKEEPQLAVFYREGQFLMIEYLKDLLPNTFRFETKPTL